MLLNEGIKNIWELKNGFTPRWVEPEFISGSLKLFSFSRLSKSIAEIKQKGYSFEWMMIVLLSMPFIGAQTVNSMLKGVVKHHIEAGKDTFYRLKNKPGVCWRLLQWLFAFKFKKLAEEKFGKDKQGVKCIVFDDTFLAKTGKRIEKVSRMFDHVTKRHMLGFKLLLMGFWDGVSLLPVDFSLHRERGTNKDKPYGLKKRELKRQFHKKRKKETCSYERACETDESKISCTIKMFKRAISLGFVADYVLVDSWFTCQELIEAVLSVKKHAVNLIGMYKIVKTKFLYCGNTLTYNEIRNRLGKPKRCRKLKLHYLEAEVEYNGRIIKLFFSKKNKNGKWKVFICTDTRLSFIGMIKIYQIRWSIEVFFKEAKGLLGLGKCQSKDFDAQIADATITMIQYMLLTMRYRIDNYETIGGLFAQVQESAVQLRLNQRLWGLFIEIMNIIEMLFDGVDADELIEKMLNDEAAYQKISLLLNGSPGTDLAA